MTISDVSRKITLVCAILVSGGLLVIPRIPLLVLVIIFGLISVRFKLKQRSGVLYFAIFILVILAAYILRSGVSELESWLSRLLYFTSAFMLLWSYVDKGDDFSSLAMDYKFLGRFMSLQAIATVAVAYIIPSIFSSFESNSSEYYTVGYFLTFHLTENSSGPFVRPDGFFFEPGVFQFYLNLAVAFELFRSRSILWAGITIVAVCCTQSTTGLLILIISLMFFFKNLFITKLHGRSLISGLFIFIILLFFIGPLKDNIESKFIGNQVGSSLARQYDLLAGIGVVANNPILGIGFNVERYWAEVESIGFIDTSLTESNVKERTSSNGLIQIFYTLGVPLGFLFVFGLIRQRLFLPRGVIVLSVLLTLASEALAFTPFFLAIFFSGLLLGVKSK